MNAVTLTQRTDLLAKVVTNLSELYHTGGLSEKQKGFLEVLIGAGIWYLPSGKELFSGKISRAALDEMINNSTVKLVEEHGFPRKVAGKTLFNEHLENLVKDNQTLKTLYLDKLGRFNLVLKEENQRLKKFQTTKVFVSEEEAYRLAGIELITLNQEHYEEYPLLKKYKP